MTQLNNNYTTSITVKKSPSEVFEAIKNVKGWWIGDVQGDADQIGSEFKYIYKEFHDTTQKVIELVPNKKIVWKVTQSKINFVKDKDEWKDTEITFEIAPAADGQTQVNFTHKGLTPAIECYEGCSGGWNFYIHKSLENFITQGQGIDPQF